MPIAAQALTGDDSSAMMRVHAIDIAIILAKSPGIFVAKMIFGAVFPIAAAVVAPLLFAFLSGRESRAGDSRGEHEKLLSGHESALGGVTLLVSRRFHPSRPRWLGYDKAMTSAEREYAIGALERSRAALLEIVESLNETQWSYKPSADEWSPADCVEHLAVVEAMLIGRIQKAIEGPAAPADELAQCAGKEKLIEKAVPSRGVKVKAPEPARPSGRFGNAADLIAHFKKTRAHTIEYARTTTDPIRERTIPHFVFGPLDGYQWLIFIAAHTDRHLKQLVEVTEAEALAHRTASGL